MTSPAVQEWVNLYEAGQWNNFARRYLGEKVWQELLKKLPETYPAERRQALQDLAPMEDKPYQTCYRRLPDDIVANNNKPLIFKHLEEAIKQKNLHANRNDNNLYADCVYFVPLYFETYSGELCFENAIFAENITFNNCSRLGLNLKNALFFKEILFSKSMSNEVFITEINAEGAIFNDDVEFKNINFTKASSFANAIFNKKALFENVEFKDSISFYNTTFKQQCHFRECIFHKDAFFNHAKFNSKDPNASQLLETPTLANGFESISPSFMGSEFKGFAVFHKTEFHTIPHFENVKVEAIDFTDCVINDHLKNWKEYLKDIKEKSIKNNFINKKPQTQFLAYDASAWAALVRMMEKVNNPDKRLEFHNRALLVDKEFPANKYAGFQYYIYRCLGGGRSVIKPLLCWLGLLFLFASVYWLYLCLTVGCTKESFGLSLGYSLVHSFPTIAGGIDMIKEYNHQIGRLPWHLILIRLLHSIFSIITLFMTGLAIRNRFRIK